MFKNAMFKIIIGALFLSLFTIGCSDSENESGGGDENSVMLNSSNEFVLSSLANEDIVVIQNKENFKLENQKTTLVLFDIFATWCPPCKKAVPHLNSLQKTFKNDLVVIGISIEEDITTNKLIKFKNEHGAKYIISASPENRSLAFAMAKEIQLGTTFSIPTLVLYKDGKYVNHYIGRVQEEFIISDIKRALGT